MNVKDLNETQRRELIENTLDKSMFVEAGAGAGKTTLIVKRIVNQLKAGFLPREIVAITFTNAATHELKERIVTAAHKESMNQELTDEQRIRMTNAIATIDQMQISTIHSFCHRILTEKSLDAGMPMALSLIDGEEENRVLEENYLLWAKGLKREDWEQLLEGGKYYYRANQMLGNVTKQLVGLSSDMQIKVSLPEISKEEFEEFANPFMEEFTKLVLDKYFEGYDIECSDLEDIDESHLASYGKKVIAAMIAGDAFETLKLLSKEPSTKGYIFSKPTKDYLRNFYMNVSEKELSEEVKNRAAVLLELREYVVGRMDEINRVLGGYENKIYKPYLTLGKEAADYCKRHIGKGILTNDMLIEKTYELLRDSKEARDFFREKFKCIYVDEFQDTDHIQDALVRLLAEGEKEGSIRDGALFVVGDPKQSIYRFRGAEPEVYFHTKEIFEGLDNAYVIELFDNYRSSDLVIEWVNQQFENKSITGTIPYKAMNIVNHVPEAELSKQTIAGIYYDENPKEKGKKLEDDIIRVTCLIKKLKEEDYWIFEKDEKNQYKKRRIDYDDFLILCANTTKMVCYADAFKEHGIPVVMDSKSIVGETTYCKTFVRIYKSLADRYDRRSVFGAQETLTSLGVKEELAAICIKQMQEMTEDMDATGMLEFLKKNWRMVLRVGCDLPESELLMVQSRIVQMVETVMANSYGNAQALIEALEEYLDLEIQHELVLDEKTKAVRFMNLHKAKGLEGNIVIWTNREENSAYREGSYREGTDFYPALYDGRFVWGGYNRDMTMIENAKNQDAEERIRLEYVAATRAKQAVIFMDTYPSRGATPLFTNDYDLGEKSIDYILGDGTLTTPEVDYDERMLQMEHCEIDASDVTRKPIFTSQSPSDFEDESAGKQNLGERVQGTLVRPYGNIFGNVMHRTFELMINRLYFPREDMHASDEAVINSCYLQAISENIADIPAGDVVHYKTFLHEAIWAYGKWWGQNQMFELVEETYTELPFSYYRESGDADTWIWKHGSADLVVRMKDGTYRVYDYKSDNDEKYATEADFEERLRGKYTGQIEAYKEAVSECFGVPVESISASLISFTQKDVAPGEKLRVRVTSI